MREVGAFQWSVIVMYAITVIPWLWGNIAILVVAPKIPHWCRDASPSFQNLTEEQQRRIMTSSEVCQRPDVNFTTMTSEQLLTSNFTSVPWIPCDQGVSYDHSEFDYTATEQYNLGCGNEWLISMTNTIYMLGFFLAAAPSGALADRFGRKTVMVAGGVLGAAAQCMIGLAPNLATFLVGKFLGAVFEMTAYTGSVILCIELVRKDQRILANVFVTVVGAGGNACFFLLAMSIRNHQHIHVMIAILYLVFALANLWYIPESPRWLTSQHRTDDAHAVVQRMADFNGQNAADLRYLVDVDETEKVEGGRKANILDLVRTSTLRKRTIILCAIWFNIVLVSYALLFNLGDFGPDVRTSIVIQSLLDLPGLALLIATLDIFGRQVSSFCYMLLAGICCFAMAPLVGATHSPLLLSLALLGKVLSGNQFFVVYMHTPELYPTVIRTMGLGTASTVARVAGMVAPQITLLNRFWPPFMVVILGFAGLLCAVLTPLLPDTTGYELPQTLEDGERFRADHTYRLTLPPDFRKKKCCGKTGHGGRSREMKVTVDEPSVTTPL